MQKKEIIWRYILYETLERKRHTFTQKDIAAHFGFSTSTVFNALKAPRKLGAIEVTGRFFRLRDAEKLLLLWASARMLAKDIILKMSIPAQIREIEGMMPPDVIFGACSAYRLKYGEAVADYDQIYVYTTNPAEIKKRFSQFTQAKKAITNLYILKPDPYLSQFGSVTPDIQTFSDLWNISAWYAKDYLNALRQKFNF